MYLLANSTPESCTLLGTFVNDEILKKIEEEVKKKLELVIVDQDKYLEIESKLKSRDSNSNAQFVIDREFSSEEKLARKDPYPMVLKECIEFAVKNNASDIHIEPKEDGVVIKVRILGELQAWKTLDKDHKSYFINTCKDILNLDLSIVGRPQDSRAAFPYLSVDFRVNSLPLIYGEKIVLRLLEQNKKFDLTSIGFDQKTSDDLHNVINLKNGLVLISGPTGSGKTTTLYSLISAIDSKRKNISTLENPVEYRLPGINQVDIGSSKGLTFSTCLRALMRQDPDVLLIGEIRDQETAEAAFKAASTGHLVFSTVHANGPIEVIERLQNLGIDEFTIKNNLKFSSAQRLLQKLCPHCSIKIDNERLKNPRKRTPKGCDHCLGGVVGRIPILSYLKHGQITGYFAGGNSDFTTLKDFAFNYADKGEIDCFDVFGEP